mmetsp:Transcript_9747/g.21082  ORF Transcript_9747/g.21082 Transcript_9747/m.21082 type:complete len:359 (+) Transcript_9747:425-1501(+)
MPQKPHLAQPTQMHPSQARDHLKQGLKLGLSRESTVSRMIVGPPGPLRRTCASSTPSSPAASGTGPTSPSTSTEVPVARGLWEARERRRTPRAEGATTLQVRLSAVAKRTNDAWNAIWTISWGGTATSCLRTPWFPMGSRRTTRTSSPPPQPLRRNLPMGKAKRVSGDGSDRGEAPRRLEDSPRTTSWRRGSVRQNSRWFPLRSWKIFEAFGPIHTYLPSRESRWATRWDATCGIVRNSLTFDRRPPLEPRRWMLKPFAGNSWSAAPKIWLDTRPRCCHPALMTRRIFQALSWRGTCPDVATLIWSGTTRLKRRYLKWNSVQRTLALIEISSWMSSASLMQSWRNAKRGRTLSSRGVY